MAHSKANSGKVGWIVLCFVLMAASLGVGAMLGEALATTNAPIVFMLLPQSPGAKALRIHEDGATYSSGDGVRFTFKAYCPRQPSLTGPTECTTEENGQGEPVPLAYILGY